MTDVDCSKTAKKLILLIMRSAIEPNLNSLERRVVQSKISGVFREMDKATPEKQRDLLALMLRCRDVLNAELPAITMKKPEGATDEATKQEVKQG